MSSDRNPVIGFPRYTESVTFSASTEATDYPSTNLGVLPLAQTWESTSVTNQWIKGDFDKPRGARFFLICRHNLSLNASFRLRLYEDDAATQSNVVFDSDTATEFIGGSEIWPLVYGDELEWEDDNWLTGKYTEEELSDSVWYRPIWLDRIYIFKSFRLDITDDDNTDGVLRIGMVDVSQGWQPSRGIALGHETGFIERTSTVTAHGGVDYHERLNKKRFFRGTLPSLPRDEAKGKTFELLRRHDKDVPFAWLLDPTDTKHWLRDCFLAKNEKLTALQRGNRNYETVQLNHKEAF